jgi:vitamin B12 transporter
LGPRASQKASASVSTTLGATSFSAGVSRFTTDGFSAVDPSQFSSVNPDADGYRNTSSNLSLIHRLSAAHSFGLRTTQADADTQFDNAFGAPSDIQTSKTKLSQTTLFTDNTWGSWRSRLSLSEQSDRSVSQDDGFFGSVDGFTTQSTVLNWTNTVPINSDWLLSAGLEKQRQRVETSSDVYAVYNKARDTTAVFAGLEGKVGAGSAQVNARHDKVGDLTKSTGYLGYGYPLTDSFKATASVSSAFNAPPLGYLFAPGFGNPLLKPEQARSREVGVQYEQGSQLVRASYFDTRIEDQLNYDFASQKFENIGRTRNSGLEVSYRGTLGASDLRASLTLQDPVNEITNQRLNRRAETLFSLGVSHPVGPWRLGADLQYSGERPDIYTDPSTFSAVKTTLAAGTVLDLSVAYKLSPTVMLKARLDNATDEKYQTVYGYNQQPRSLYMGVTWSSKL